MSVRLKLTIMFLAIAAIPLVLVGALTFHNYRNSLEAAHISSLRDITAFKANKIETYFANLKANIKVAQSGYVTKKNLPVFCRLAGEPNNPEFIDAKKQVDVPEQEMQRALGLMDIMHVNRDGKIVYSSNPQHYSKEFLQALDDPGQQAFEQGKREIYFSDVFIDSQKNGKQVMLITAPAADLNGVFSGVIAFEVDMASIYKIVQDNTGLGKTGESVLGKKVRDEVLYLSPLKYDPNAAMLKKRVKLGAKVAVPIQNAVQGKTGAAISVDYRGKGVIGAWTYLPTLGWGLATKIDAGEAFADVTNLRNLVIIILVIVSVLSGVMAFSIAQSISGPIKALSKGAEIIGSGDLDYRVATNSKDEIGLLSRSFDKMTKDFKATTASRDELNREIAERKKAEEALRPARHELEMRVEQRTAELAQTVKTLQDEVIGRTLAEKSLLESGKELRSASLYARSLLEASLDPLVTISPEGKITDVNRATELATGVVREELIGSDFSDYFTEPQKANEGYQKVISEGFVTDYPLTIRNSDGSLMEVLYNATVYRDEAGQVQGVFAAARDITEKKAAEIRQNVTNSLLEMFAKKHVRKEYLDAVVEVIRNWSECECAGIRVKDDHGNIPYESYVGFSQDFIALESELCLQNDKNCICTRAILQQPCQSDEALVTPGGSLCSNDTQTFINGLSEKQLTEYRGHCMRIGFQSLAVIPIRYRDEVVGAIHIADFKKDMVPEPKIHFIESTIAPLVGEAIHRFNAESELEEYRLHLEELVKQRTEELARSNRDLEQFAYVASHDLQEPLRAVAGFVGLLKIELQSSLNDKTKEYMQFVVDGAARMQALISGLLEYSRVETRGRKLQPTDAKAALDHALRNLQLSIEQSGAKVTADTLPTLRVDSVQLAQLFQNLIGNAIKFRSEHPPQIHIRASRLDNTWQFGVADNGIGIEPQYAERIFLIFQRLHTREKYSGTGIGLAICKKIVERRGGRIWVESELGRGSTFYFTVPDKEGISQ